jgi:archaellum component FlaC
MIAVSITVGVVAIAAILAVVRTFGQRVGDLATRIDSMDKKIDGVKDGLADVRETVGRIDERLIAAETKVG